MHIIKRRIRKIMHNNKCNLNSTKVWAYCLLITIRHVSGQVKNVGKQTESNVQIIAHFYNSKGGNVNGLQQVFLNPMNLKSQQQGTFNIKAPISQMSGIPTFVRLELVLSS